MNNNRNNNRRRGRGNNNRGGGNPMQGNRIDSRARGNAPQMLDKYKKLANDAAMNDDRVQTEYYLQFADHYFRVIADSKAQKDEAQAKRNADRGQDQSDDDDDQDEDGRNTDRKPRGRKGPRKSRKDADFEQGSEGDEGDQSDSDNPFTRSDGDAKPKRKARTPRKKAADEERAQETSARETSSKDVSAKDNGGLDPDMLPPSIVRASEDGEDSPKPARKGLKPRRKPKDGGEEALEAVG